MDETRPGDLPDEDDVEQPDDDEVDGEDIPDEDSDG